MPRIKRPFQDRFLERIQFTPDCWNFTGGDMLTYGRIWSGGRKSEGKSLLAHRVAWEYFTGCAIPEGLVVDHECENPRCCNPEHLQLVTGAENVFLGSAKHGQRMASCKRNHPVDRVVFQEGKPRKCRECRKENMRRYRTKEDFIDREEDV